MNNILLHYLAYGSNLHPVRLAQRVRSAMPLGVVPIPRWRLAFHKRSRDGSGKCMFYDTAEAADMVYGVLYEFNACEKGSLDTLEGRDRGYNEQLISLLLNGQTYRPYVYVAANTHIDASLAPYDWYKEMVLLGARYHRLPPDYIARIEAVASIPDPDRERARENEKTLINMRRNAAQECSRT